MNNSNHANSLNQTGCLCYMYYNVLFKPKDDVKEHFFILFFLGLIIGIPNR